jgi:thymidylate synthase (FAD)
VKAVLLTYTPLSTLKEAFPELTWRELLPHLSYTIAVENVSRACSHQLVRHRIASFSQQSQRYITVKRLNEKIVVPLSVGESSTDDYLGVIDDASKGYQKLVAKGVPREDARFLLPNATETSLLMTMDGRSLMHFLGLRTCNRAQWEIRELADMILGQLRAAEPEIFNHAGPYCYQLGYCPEGRHTCGKMKEALERYGV